MRSERFCRAGLLAAATMAAALVDAPAGAQSQPLPHPVYRVALKDAVTADNRPRPVSHPSGGCTVTNPCYLPDPNPVPTAGLPVDSHTADVYERPSAPGPGAQRVLRAVDIASHQVGADEAWFYFRINLAGPVAAGGGAQPSYGFELDFDDDPAGEVLVVAGGRAGRLGPRFSAVGLSAHWNRNSNILGANAQLPDGPGGTPDGYEFVAVMGGVSRLPDQPGGPKPLLARVAAKGAAVELAVPRAFLEATKLNERGVDTSGDVDKIALRPLASAAAVDHTAFSLHDRLGRRESGSAHPFLRLPPPDPTTCPVNEEGMTVEGRAALDSGTDDDTGIPNPCYPTAALAAYDNAYYVSTTFNLPPPEQTPLRVDDTAPERSGSGDAAFLPVLVLVLTGLGGAGALAVFVRHRRQQVGAAEPVEPSGQS